MREGLRSGQRPVVASDLDGTLLDHDTYDWAAAAPTLARLRRNGVPLVLASSKTPAEIIALTAKMGPPAPFIAENGAAIGLPDANARDGYRVDLLGPSREEILSILVQNRAAPGIAFEGFSDLGRDGIALATGLDGESAARADARAASEPIAWAGSEAGLKALAAKLAEVGIRLEKGGRFLCAAGGPGKAGAVSELLARLDLERSEVFLVALGDAPNDTGLLAMADLPVIARRKDGSAADIAPPGRGLCTLVHGPAGWAGAVEAALDLCGIGG